MCCCGKPVINGEPGYKWQPNDAPTVRQPNPPDIEENDVLLYDEPGRCGGLDSHCHHYRLVKRTGRLFLIVRNGAGDTRFGLSLYGDQPRFDALDSNARYWLFNAIFHAHADGVMKGAAGELERWRRAVAEKRIKTRKQPRSNAVKVWIEPRIEPKVA